MVSLPDFHLPQDGDERVRDRRIEHISVNLGERTREHEGGHVGMKVLDMGQAHVA
jgi:hypothetical protein